VTHTPGRLIGVLPVRPESQLAGELGKSREQLRAIFGIDPGHNPPALFQPTLGAGRSQLALTYTAQTCYREDHGGSARSGIDHRVERFRTLLESLRFSGDIPDYHGAVLTARWARPRPAHSGVSGADAVLVNHAGVTAVSLGCGTKHCPGRPHR